MSAQPRKSLGDVTNDLPAPPPTTTVKPPTPPPPASGRAAPSPSGGRAPARQVERLRPALGDGLRAPAAAGGRHAHRRRRSSSRTGRRRSMEIRNARPTTSTSRGPRSVMNRTTTASRRRDVRTSQTTRAPSTDRWNSTTRSVSRAAVDQPVAVGRHALRARGRRQGGRGAAGAQRGRDRQRGGDPRRFWPASFVFNVRAIASTPTA